MNRDSCLLRAQQRHHSRREGVGCEDDRSKEASVFLAWLALAPMRATLR